jgi:hypothetical protein
MRLLLNLYQQHAVFLEKIFDLEVLESGCPFRKSDLSMFQINHGARNLMILPAELEHEA